MQGEKVVEKSVKNAKKKIVGTRSRRERPQEERAR
jgi:hypothetical protein